MALARKKSRFCESEAHYCGRYDVVVDVQDRRDSLKKERYCFNRLKQGHSKKDWRAKKKKKL